MVPLPTSKSQGLDLEQGEHLGVVQFGGEALEGQKSMMRIVIAISLTVCLTSTKEDKHLMTGPDDLPVIRDNIKKGFLETQSTVNKWVNSLKKKIDGEDEDDFQRPPRQGYQPQQSYGGRGSSEFGRRSADRERYDADPQVLGDDFAGLSMRDNEGNQLA